MSTNQYGGNGQGASATQNAGAKAVFFIVIGSTMVEALLYIATAKREGMHLVPHRWVAIDTLPYENLISRLVQCGWSQSFVEQQLPRDRYLRLESAVTEGMDFNNPLNAWRRHFLFEPQLQKDGQRPNTAGAMGTPAIGAMKAIDSEADLEEFLRRHIHALSKVRNETLGIDGITVHCYTTLRGGTGSGSTPHILAITKPLLPEESEIHLIAAMPCVYDADGRAYANAYARIIEDQYFHRYGGGIPSMEDI